MYVNDKTYARKKPFVILIKCKVYHIDKSCSILILKETTEVLPTSSYACSMK